MDVLFGTHCVMSRRLANYNDTHVLFGEGRISYGHLGRTNLYFMHTYSQAFSASTSVMRKLKQTYILL